MKKIIFAILLIISIPLLVLPAKGKIDADYDKAFNVAKKKDWNEVDNLISDKEDDLLNRVFTWMKMIDEDKKHGFEEISNFVLDNHSFPKHITLRKNVELAINDKTDPKLVKAWFKKYPAKTYNGLKYQVYGLIKDKEMTKAKALLKKAWVNNNYSRKDERDFLKNFGRYLDKKDYSSKIDRLLWSGQITEARSLLHLSPKGHRRLFNARITLKTKTSGIQKSFNLVPKELKDDPGLTFDRAVYRRKRGDYDGAIARHKSKARLNGVEQRWYRERDILLRRLIKEKKYKDAYNLVLNHNHTNNLLYVNSEWNLTFIAYQFLKDYKKALVHLSNMERKSSSPVSRARIHYYSGMSLKKLGKEKEAEEEFKKGAKYNMTFYGQLSGAKLSPLIRQANNNSINSDYHISLDKKTYDTLNNHELVKIMRVLSNYEQYDLVRVFAARLNALYSSKSNMLVLAKIYKNLNRPELLVGISRRLRLSGIDIGRIAYPKPEYEIPEFADTNLTYAIIRQESDFNQKAISRANAMGLMQVLPSTAKDVSREIKTKYSKNKLLEDGEYNVLIGTNYIEGLIKRFDGSYILAIAAYNAGPTNVRRWIKANGKPGKTEEEILRWIELIPFSETRNYVQRVLENLYIYRIIGQATRT